MWWSALFAIVSFLAGFEALLVAIYVSQPTPCTLSSVFVWTTIPWLFAILIFVAGAIMPCTRAIFAYRRRTSGSLVVSGSRTSFFAIVFAIIFAVLLAISIEVLAAQVCALVVPGWPTTLWLIAATLFFATLAYTIAWAAGASTDTSADILCVPCMELDVTSDSAPACFGRYPASVRVAGLVHAAALSLVGLGATITALLLINYFVAVLPPTMLVVHTLPLLIALAIYIIVSVVLIVVLARDDGSHAEDIAVVAISVLIAGGAFATCLLLGTVATAPHGTLWPLYVSLFVAALAFLFVWKDRTRTVAKPTSYARVVEGESFPADGAPVS